MHGLWKIVQSMSIKNNRGNLGSNGVAPIRAHRLQPLVLCLDIQVAEPVKSLKNSSLSIVKRFRSGEIQTIICRYQDYEENRHLKHGHM